MTTQYFVRCGANSITSYSGSCQPQVSIPINGRVFHLGRERIRSHGEIECTLDGDGIIGLPSATHLNRDPISVTRGAQRLSHARVVGPSLADDTEHWLTNVHVYQIFKAPLHGLFEALAGHCQDRGVEMQPESGVRHAFDHSRRFL